MLQPPGNQWAKFFMAPLFSVCFFIACKSDTSTHTEDEAMYLLDYESPQDKWGFMDTLGNMVIKATFDDVGPFSGGYAAVSVKGKWGYINREGSLIIKPHYKSAWAFHENLGRVKPFAQNDQFLHRSGKTLSSNEWAAADDFYGGLAKVKLGDTFGYIDTTGKMVLPAIYSRAWTFQNEFAIIEYEDKKGLITKTGEEFIQPRFDKISILEKEKLILCIIDESSTVFDFDGNELANLPNVKMVESSGSLISLRKGDKMYFFDLNEKTILTSPAWDNIFYLGDNRWAGKNETGFYLLDSKGEMLRRKAYTQINRYRDGLAACLIGEYWGYVDEHGLDVTEYVFGLAWDYKENFARAAFTDGIAFLNRQQQLAFYPPPGTIDMRDFSEGLAPVQISK